jgi:hypothetical protein
MKKLFLILIAILFLSVPVLAEERLLLNGVDATGASKQWYFGTDQSAIQHTVSCYYTDANASITALVITLEGSIDLDNIDASSAHWFTLATHTFTAAELTAKQAMFFLTTANLTRIRVNITTLTGVDVGTDEVFALYSPETRTDK